MTQLARPRPRTLIVLAVVTALVLAAPAAAKTYKNKDLKGTYRFTVAEIRVDGPDLQYCDSYGTMAFDGKGGAVSVTPIRKCILHPSGTPQVDFDEEGFFDYEVMPNGEFVLYELDDLGNRNGYDTHGRIVQKGNLLIVDGTQSWPGHPEFLLTHAVAAKE